MARLKQTVKRPARNFKRKSCGVLVLCAKLTVPVVLLLVRVHAD